MIRQNVCQRDAPSVAAACSWSSPISRSTGSTSRTTNGSDTKIVASTMPGTEKITWMPARRAVAEPAGRAVDEHERESDHDRRDRERQVDQRVEQPLAAELAARQHQRVTIPKTVFSGTAIAVTSIVSQNAWMPPAS